MAIGAITKAATGDSKGGGFPIFFDRISFAGDGAYASGGTAGFQASFRAAVPGNREILAVIPEDCGGYYPVYDKTNDKLKVYEQTDTATSPLIETATANLSGTTFNLVIISK